jgi:hypothetical protein
LRRAASRRVASRCIATCASQVLVVFSFMLIAYSSFVTYLQPTVWKLLLLIQQVYMCRVVLRLFLLLNRAPAADRAQLLAELRANGRATLLPW